MKGDDGITTVSPNTFNVDKGSTWQTIKPQAMKIASPKEDFEIEAWHLNDEGGKLLTDGYIFEKDETVFAKTKRKVATYKVEHLQENKDNEEYTIYESEDETGEAGKNTSAKAKTYEGFIAQSFAQSIVKVDGSTIVQIKYKRKITSLILNLKGGQTETKLEDGKDGNKLLKDKYGAKVEVKAPTKDDFKFEKWEPPLPTSFPIKDDSENIYTAKWRQAVITLTIQGDSGVDIANPNTIKIAKDATWKSIKPQVESIATPKEDFEIEAWHLKDEGVNS